ncbi:MAG: hypothetical protein MZV70_21515 [Desulfobacterales bacterium]|nr:hypothetical protein [Desulfobacterales bacterium]
MDAAAKAAARGVPGLAADAASASACSTCSNCATCCEANIDEIARTITDGVRQDLRRSQSRDGARHRERGSRLRDPDDDRRARSSKTSPPASTRS